MDNIYIKHHPLTNLTNRGDYDQSEERFAKSFNQFYEENHAKIHGLRTTGTCDTIREIPISNLGIADMISISWRLEANRINKLKKEGSLSDFTLRAFEFKVTDWKKGLMQAFRYTYFSHSTILVIPIEVLDSAIKSLDTFKKLNVGLWGYDHNKETVRKIFTPRPNKKYVEKYFSQAVNKAGSFLTESAPIA